VFEVVFTKAASVELADAQDWYERESPGLGECFRAEVDVTIKRLSVSPLQFAVIHKRVRRALLRRFPYMLFFVVDGETLWVIACFHASRDPRIWQQRR
jgi:plasmid stabilization system protein ParE